MTVHESAWRYRSFRWLKLATGLVAASTLAYAFANPAAERAGDTRVGYGLGILCAALVAWLTWLGVRRRSYTSTGAPLRGWLSAHVYLGLSLLVLVPLHCAFRFDLNVHTLAYALVVATILSGMLGVFYYSDIPRRMTENRPGETLEGMFEQIAELDRECRTTAESLPDVLASAVRISVEETRLGGSVFRQLSGRDPRCGTARAFEAIAVAMETVDDRDRDQVRRLLEAVGLKRLLVTRVRRDIRFNALLRAWLVVHVALASATTVAVASHVVVVFLYR